MFVPAGGGRHPVRATFAAFAVSGLYHEGGTLLFTGRASGWFMLYFLLQAVMVVATSRSYRFRRLANRVPLASTVITLMLVLSSGVIFFLALDGVDPAATWQRCRRRPPQV